MTRPQTKPRRVIVTGGATNIGRAITEAFLEIGCRVAIGQIDVEDARPLARRFGQRVIPLKVDVGDPAKCRRFILEAAVALGGVDVLVNNAAITGKKAMSSLVALTPRMFARMVDVNIGGAVFCTQAAVPFLKRSHGVVVHISSINAMRPQRNAMVYAATKAALSSLAQSMAKELAGHGIRVVAIAPGDIRTEHSEKTEDHVGKRRLAPDRTNYALSGSGDPNDVAATVVFVCSEKAKFVNGVTWVIDGGALA